MNKKIQYLEEEIASLEESLHNYEMELIDAYHHTQKSSLMKDIRNSKDRLKTKNLEYIALLEGITALDFQDGEGTVIWKQVESLETYQNTNESKEIQEKLNIILQEIKTPNKSASAKLKIALPLIPELANIELDLNVGSFLGNLWGKIRGLMKENARVEEPLVETSVQVSTAKSKKQSKKESNNFLAEIQKHIAKALSMSGMSSYTNVLWEELNKVLVALKMKEIECNPVLIAEQLVLALQQGGKECPVINKALLNSVVDCLDKDKGKEKYEQCIPHRKIIIDQIEQVLGYLVLSLVDEDDARDLSNWLRNDLSNLYFELHVRTLGGVEFFISMQQGRKANFALDGRQVTGRHLIYIDVSPLNWHEKARLDEIQRIIWDSVFNDDRQHPLDGDDIEELKAELITLREIERDPENYYVAIRFEDDGDDSYRKICENFLSDLKIPMVRFGVKGNKQAFGGIEHNLMSAVARFLKTINKYT